MKNINVYKNKLGLPEKYIDEPTISLMLRKPGTLSKREKEWLISYVALLELRDLKPTISRDKLSDEFVKTIKK
jgi:hypothetical protein